MAKKSTSKKQYEITVTQGTRKRKTYCIGKRVLVRGKPAVMPPPMAAVTWAMEEAWNDGFDLHKLKIAKVQTPEGRALKRW